eukprot:984124-Amphidinium_carterae.2
MVSVTCKDRLETFSCVFCSYDNVFGCHLSYSCKSNPEFVSPKVNRPVQKEAPMMRLLVRLAKCSELTRTTQSKESNTKAFSRDWKSKNGQIS